MSQYAHIPETILAEVWREQNFNRELATETGEKIEVMYVGDENHETGGPDFINARIKIGNLTYLGDIEIDNTQSDWRHHGHNLNKRFNKVILHVIVNNETNYKIVYSQDGRRIHTFCLANFIDEQLYERLRKAIIIESDNKTNKVHCFKVASYASEKDKIEILTELGLTRFKKKCERMINRLSELVYADNNKVAEPIASYAFPAEVYQMKLTLEELNKKQVWMQLFYEEVFEALGFSQNKQIMQNLAHQADIEFLRKISAPKEHFSVILESIYFKISGLIPENHSKLHENVLQYIRDIQENWGKFGDTYNGKFYEATDWHFAKQRPQNFPTLRIAAGARFVKMLLHDNMIETMIKKFVEIHTISVVKSSIRSMFVVKADGFWQKHFTFETKSYEDNKYFIGSSRADEIFINVVLPFLYTYFHLFGKPKLAQRAIDIYTEITADTDNHLVREVAEALKLEHSWNKAVLSQGMIELFRSYCSKEKCEDCLIGQKVFAEEF